MTSSENDTNPKCITESDNYTDSSEDCIDLKKNSAALHKTLNTLSEDELLRYEAFRRVGFKRNMIKRLCLEVIGQSCNPKFIIAVCGLSKVFVGELIDEAKNVQKQWNDTGALLVTHIHEAFRRIYNTKPNMKSGSKNRPW